MCCGPTPQAAALLQDMRPALPERTPGETYAWGADWRLNAADLKPGHCVAMLSHGDKTLEFHFVGQFGPDETLLRVVAWTAPVRRRCCGNAWA